MENKFLKIQKNENLVTTSINIENKHRAFLDKYGLNLSALVRSMLDDMLREDQKNQTETLKKAE